MWLSPDPRATRVGRLRQTSLQQQGYEAYKHLTIWLSHPVNASNNPMHEIG